MRIIISFAERAENDRFGRLCLASLTFSNKCFPPSVGSTFSKNLDFHTFSKNQNENDSFLFCFMPPPKWSLKKRRKSVGLEHKGPSLGLFGPTKLAQICTIPAMPRKRNKTKCENQSKSLWLSVLRVLFRMPLIKNASRPRREALFCKPTPNTLH